MKKILVFLCLLPLLLFGCTDTPEQTTPQIVAPKAAPAVTVYEGAQQQYLEPFGLYSRKRTQAPEFVMLHFSSAVMVDWDDPYNIKTIRGIYRKYEVSPHYIIDRDGTIYCYIPEDRAAYHAGYGTWDGNPKYTDLMNDYAIGIELVAIGSERDMAQYLSAEEYRRLDPSLPGYTEAQYEALQALVQDICSRYRIPLDEDHIIGHEAYSPEKADPGELFDWNRIIKEQG